MPARGVMKETAEVGVATVLVAHGSGRLHQRVAGQRMQKADSVEEIRLAGAIRPHDAREGTEAYIDVDEVLEAGDLQSGQHGAIPGWKGTVLAGRGRAAHACAAVWRWRLQRGELWSVALGTASPAGTIVLRSRESLGDRIGHGGLGRGDDGTTR